MLLTASLLVAGFAATAPPVKSVVMKFGGSSVRDSERILEVCRLVKKQIDAGLEPHLVCSAMGKTTNNLLAAADLALDEGLADLSPVRKLHADTAIELGVADSPNYLQIQELLDECERTLEGVAMLGELSPRTRDRVVAYGERMSGRMVAACLGQLGVPAEQYESWDLGLQTTSDFGEAMVLDECWPVLKERVRAIPQGTVGVITGFIGKDASGAITTLGRGGSDLTASLIGSAAAFDEVQVWKDVDGILTADPRVCEQAQPVPLISYSEAAELAYFGAQVLHPVAMQPAVRTGTPVRVKNSYNWEAPGTLITGAPTDGGLVSAITSKSDVVVVDIESTRMLGSYGFLSNVFEAFKRRRLSVDVVATSEVSVSLTLNRKVMSLDNNRKFWKVSGDGACQNEAQGIEDDALRGVVEDLSACADIEIKAGRSIVTLIANVGKSSNVMATVFQVMSSLGVQVEMISQGASKVNISMVVPGEKEKDVIRALHACFFEDSCIVPMD